MSDLDQRIASLSRERLLLLNTRLQERLGEMDQAAREPIAVLAIGCRFPGARTPEEFWQLLSRRRQTVTEVPPERWDIDMYYSPDPEAAAKMYTRYGSFLEDAAEFAPRLFGLSLRHALSLAPPPPRRGWRAWRSMEGVPGARGGRRGGGVPTGGGCGKRVGKRGGVPGKPANA